MQLIIVLSISSTTLPKNDTQSDILEISKQIIMLNPTRCLVKISYSGNNVQKDDQKVNLEYGILSNGFPS